MPARKPRQLKVMRGTLRKDREPREPVEPRKGRAEAEAWLSPGERAAFDELAEQAERCGTPTASFPHVLTAAAIVWDQLRRDCETIGTEGMTYESKTTSGARKLVLRPEVYNRASTLKLLRGYLTELGLTPASIGRLDLAAMPADESDEDRVAKYMKSQRFFGPRRR